jgi:hypothetical protein
LAQLVINVRLLDQSISEFDHKKIYCTTVLGGLCNKKLVKEHYRAIRQAVRRVLRFKIVERDKWVHFSATLISKLANIPQSYAPKTEWNNRMNKMCKSAYSAPRHQFSQKTKPIMITK